MGRKGNLLPGGEGKGDLPGTRQANEMANGMAPMVTGSGYLVLWRGVVTSLREIHRGLLCVAQHIRHGILIERPAAGVHQQRDDQEENQAAQIS